MPRVVFGEEGTLTAAARIRTPEIADSIESLKPSLREAVSGLSLQDDIKWLSERVGHIANDLYVRHRQAPELAEAVSNAARMVVEGYGRINRFAEKANDQYGPLQEALWRSIREELVEYGMEYLRDRYLAWLCEIYADEIQGKSVRIVPGVPGPDITPLMPLDSATARKIAHRSFCVVSESRAVLVTLDGSKNFFLRVGKRSNATIASHAFEGGSIVEKHTPDIAAAFRHVAELRYFANNVVAEHRELIAFVETYVAYTAKLSADIEREMEPDMTKSFPLYAAWKNNPRGSKAHKRARQHGETLEIKRNALTDMVDRSVAEIRDALLSKPTWMQWIEGEEGGKIRKMKLAYSVWHVSHAKREVSAALQEIEGKLGRLGIFAGQEKDRLTTERARLIKVQEELGKAPRTLAEVVPAKSDASPDLDPNFVQAICDRQVREWLRQQSFKPFFAKIRRLYDEDPSLGRVADDAGIVIPSRRHVKIARFAEKRGYRHEGHAHVRPASRGMTPLVKHIRGSRLSAGEFARLIALSMAEFLRETEWNQRHTEFSRAFEQIVVEEIKEYFGTPTEESKILLDALTDTYRVHDYHPKHDAEEDETRTDSPLPDSASEQLPTIRE